MSLFAEPKCHHCVDTTICPIPNDDYPQLNWLQCYRCNNCGKNHYQCTECINKLMTEKKQVTDHQSYHKKKRKAKALEQCHKNDFTVETNNLARDGMNSHSNDFHFEFIGLVLRMHSTATDQADLL